MIIDCSKPARAQRKKRNSVKREDAQNQMTSNEDCVQVEAKMIITKMDTMDSLREKFPRANPFELEFLMFLKESQP